MPASRSRVLARGLRSRARRRRRRTLPSGTRALFGRVRRGLTIWYIAVLIVALGIFGAVLYAGVQRTLLQPVDHQLLVSARHVARLWRVDHRCPPARFRLAAGTVSWACFAPDGTPVARSEPAPANGAAFDLQSLVQATRDGRRYDTVPAQGGAPITRRLALGVPGFRAGHPLGVVLAGTSIQGEVSTLQIMVRLMLIIGGVAVLGAGAGGLLLSGRALAPARLAFARQQDFIADASHELRTPITLLRADAEVLLRSGGQLTPEDAALLQDIVAEAHHMGAVATNLLSLARLDAGTQCYEPDLVDLADLAVALGRRVRAHALASAVDVRVVPPQPALVVADRALLEQVLLILLDNAIKYNRPGGNVRMEVYCETGRICLTVADTGRGISSEHLDRLGERFYRVDRARSRESGGAGLGLSIARGIIALHSGDLTLRSVPEHGTTATVRLPAPHGRSPDLGERAGH